MEPDILELPVRAEGELRQIYARTRRVTGRRRLGSSVLFPPDFMARHTSLPSFASLLEKCAYPNSAHDSSEEWTNWERCVRESTNFDSWKGMCRAAAKAWVIRQLGLPSDPAAPAPFPGPPPTTETVPREETKESAAFQFMSGEEHFEAEEELFEADEDPDRLLIFGEENITSTDDDDGKSWWTNGILKHPLPNGTFALYFVDAGWLYNDRIFIGILDPESNMVERDGYFVPLARVQLETEKRFAFWDQGTPGGSLFPPDDWAQWFKDHAHDVKGLTYIHFMSELDPGYRNKVSSAGVHSGEQVATALEAYAGGGPALRLGTQSIMIGKKVAFSVLTDGSGILFSALGSIRISQRERHHPVFKMFLKGFDKSMSLTHPVPGRKFVSTRQRLVKLPRQFHRDVLHRTWNTLHHEWRNHKQIAEAIKNAKNPREEASMLLDLLVKFYKGLLKDEPAILDEMLRSIESLRRRIQL